MSENKHFVIDFDSTFTQVEALDVLGEISLANDPDKKKNLAEVEALTDKGMKGEISHSSKAEWVDKDNTIYVYYPNMDNEEDVIRSILHEFEHAHQDPEEYEAYRAQGYDGRSNPHEVEARNAEEKWKNYLVDSAREPPQ